MDDFRGSRDCQDRTEGSQRNGRNASISRNENAGRGLGNPPALTFREVSLSNIYDANTTTGSITTNDSDSNPILAQPPKDLNYYRAELTGLWRKTVEDIIATGRVFSQAKNDLTPDEYKDLMAEFGFERSIAARLRAIYHCLLGVDNYLQNRLPASVSTIYEMSKVGPELLEAKLRRGEWSTTTTRADIVPRKPKPAKPKQKPSILIMASEEINQLLLDLKERLQEEFKRYPDRREDLIERIRRI
jgi:hypothetical protein